MKPLLPILLIPALLQAGGTVFAQVTKLTYGGSGDTWSEVSSLNVLMDAAAGGLQPLELRPDVNIVPVIFGAHEETPWELWQKPPNPLWEPGIPRFWRGSGNYGPKTPGPTTTVLVDGNPNTFWSQENYGPGGCKMFQEFHTIAPGGALPLQRFVLQLPPEGVVDLFGEPFANYVPKAGQLTGGWHGTEKQVAEEQAQDITGYNNSAYRPFNDVLGDVRNNLDAPIVIDFPLAYYSHVRWRTWPEFDIRPNCGFVEKLGYADFELYGNGFAAESFLRTGPLDLGNPAILGELEVHTSQWRRQPGRWEETLNASGELVDRTWIQGDLVPVDDADGEVLVRVKTGVTDDPRRYFTYTDFGELEQVTHANWDGLENSALISCHGKCSPGGGRLERRDPGWRGPVVDDYEHWTAWSGPNRGGTTRLALPKGQYFQILVSMVSHEPTDAVRLDSVTVEVLPLLAPTLVGEVVADQDDDDATLAEVPIGESTALTLAIRAAFEGRRTDGFDAIRISTPSRPEFVNFMRGEPLQEIDLGTNAIATDDSGLTIYLDRPVVGDEELRVQLRTTLYTVSERLQAQVFESGNELVRQVVDEGNASDELTTDQLQIVSDRDLPDAISNLEVTPRLLTPNGDGSNDELTIHYAMFGVLDAQVEVGIYTLSGQPMRRIIVDGQQAGINPPVMWNGRDDQGRLLAPGLYVCQVETETSRGRFATAIPVSVAY